jgi:phosphonate transport system permease protein
MTPSVPIIDVPANVLPSRKLRFMIFYLLAGAAAIILLFAFLGLTPSSFVVDFHFVTDLARQMLPPNVALFWTKSAILLSLIETLSMAFLATILGGALALFLAFFAATNTTPHPLVRLVARTLLVMNRSVPNLIVILVLLIAVGIGPFAGMLALTFGSVGMYGKFFADAIEQSDKGPLESVESVGSTRLQTIRFAVLPQVMPSLVANLFYAFDYNLRAAIPLGIFGGGGIGFELAFANGLLHYKDVLAYTILIVVMINGMERVSDWVRGRIITQPQLISR